MKKIFFSIFVFCAFLIVYYQNRIDFNIYNLLHIQHASEFKQLQNSFSDEIVFLLETQDKLEKLKELNIKYPVFQSLGMDENKNFKELIKDIALPTFGAYEQIKKDSIGYFSQNSALLFDPFSPRILPISQDFFSLASQSRLFTQFQKIQFDISNNTAYVKEDKKKLYIVLGTLKKHYKNSDLVLFAQNVRDNKIALMSGSALFSAFGQYMGNQEGIAMSVVALLASIAFLLIAFAQIKILYLVIVVMFSLVFGLGLSFLFLEHIHILALVMSASLIGIILDFAIHFICHQEGKKIDRRSIVSMRGVFALCFLIASSGYIVFFFSPLVFLHQIALISIFSLFGALLFSYFCLPSMLEDSIFRSTQSFEIGLKFFETFLSLLRKYKYVVYALIIAFIGLGGYGFLENKAKENIKSYASIPQFLLDDAIAISRLTGAIPPTQVLVLSGCSFSCERDLIMQLKQHKMLQNSKGLAQVFLDQEEQKEVLDIFKSAMSNQEITNIYSQLGIANADQFFKEVTELKPQAISEVLKNPLAKSYQPLYLSQDKRLLLIQPMENLNKDFARLLEQISQKYNAKIEFFDLTEEINEGFELIKNNAITLKLVGLVLAFLLLSLFYGIKRSSKIIAIILMGILLALSILQILGFEVNIFAFFGLILASAVGIDYVLFAQSTQTRSFLRLKSIVCACITSFISFFVLFFSSTYAVSIFGLSAATGILCVAILAILEFNEDALR